MKCNMALWDRTLRFILAVLLLTYVIAGGPFWGWGGLYFLMTAAWGLCPIYAFLKFKTIRSPRAERVTTIKTQSSLNSSPNLNKRP